jgi:hypothetical protein
MMIYQTKDGGSTWIEPEERCYPHGAERRRGRARCEDGIVRAIRAGIADTAFTIPAYRIVNGRRVRGYVYFDGETEALCFKAYAPKAAT